MIKAMFSYNQGSQGGKELAEALGIPRIKHTGSKFTGGPGKTVLNWGATTDRFPTAIRNTRIINPPDKVDVAVDKVATFQKFLDNGVPHPEFTTDRAVAVRWLEGGTMVFARTQLRAHSGRGIVIMDPDHPDTWEVAAPLYVKYMPKKDEYRIHVVNGEVIDVQRKGLRAEFQNTDGVNYKIRNLANGFVYVRNDGRVPPDCVLAAGISAVSALGLDFGAADIIYNERANAAYALEVNTAPGLSGTTIENYRAAIGQY